MREWRDGTTELSVWMAEVNWAHFSRLPNAARNDEITKCLSSCRSFHLSFWSLRLSLRPYQHTDTHIHKYTYFYICPIWGFVGILAPVDAKNLNYLCESLPFEITLSKFYSSIKWKANAAYTQRTWMNVQALSRQRPAYTNVFAIVCVISVDAFARAFLTRTHTHKINAASFWGKWTARTKSKLGNKTFIWVLPVCANEEK